MEKIIARFDGSIPLKPNQKPCEIFKDNEDEKPEEKEESISTSIEGDGTMGIKGSLSIDGKENAIFFVQGIIEQFDIKREDLDI